MTESNLKLKNNLKQSQLSEIFKNYPYPMNVAFAAAWSLIQYKGEDNLILDLQKNSAITDYYVLTTASNHTQATAMCDFLSREFKGHYNVRGVEGPHDSPWRILDIGDVMVHIFVNNARQEYNLENLFSFAKKIAIPENFYLQKLDIEKSKLSDDEADELTYF